jgi:hypothetical protein
MTEEPIQLMQDHLRVVWNHDGSMPSLTVPGKRDPCQQADMHPCLLFELVLPSTPRYLLIDF